MTIIFRLRDQPGYESLPGEHFECGGVILDESRVDRTPKLLETVQSDDVSL